VLDASRVLAGPYLAMLLGDLGAEVIKVEKPDRGDQTRAWGPPFVGPPGGQVSAYFVSANRNKRSLALDLKQAAGRAAFTRLLAAADILVENFLPGEWRRLGFRSHHFHRRFPRLVQCTVTSYGTAGPDADRPAYDVVLQAESGLMALTGVPDGEPVRVGVAIVDILAALYSLAAVLAALRRRDATGRGGLVEVSLAESAAAFLSYAAQSYLADGRQPPRLGSRHPSLTPYQALLAADGWIVVGVGSEELWRRFCAAIGEPGLAADPRFSRAAGRVKHRDELDRHLGELFAGRPVAHWEGVLRAHRVPAAPPATMEAALAAARLRGQVAALPAGAFGALETLAPPFLFDALRPRFNASPPALGEHTTAVLREAGFGRAEIARLLASGVARQAEPDRGG
jgi:crotonobetainyl-CoA:carnitine CoA-transferase CaiB-like acyl-CoA transferase